MEPITRRTLLTGACAVIALGGMPLSVAASSGVKKLPGGRLSVDLKSIPELAKIGGAVGVGTLKGVPVAISRTSSNKYIAFSLACPHQGVTVSRSDTGWVCPAHRSEFQSDGGLVLGPATTGLTKVTIKVTKGVAVLG